MRIFTFGHGTIAAEEFATTVASAGVELVVDVRSFPGSRHNPQFGRQSMESWLPESGLAYRWVRELGGRRRANADSPHTSLRNGSFRAYADYMETQDFANGIDVLLSLADQQRAAVMCSESVWWRCHRRLLADHLVLIEDIEVGHIMHDGRIQPHPVTAGVRRIGGALIYDQDPAETAIG